MEVENTFSESVSLISESLSHILDIFYIIFLNQYSRCSIYFDIVLSGVDKFQI